MKRWITALRNQAAQIAEGHYLPDSTLFADAPADIALLSLDLNVLAEAIVERDRAHQALVHEVHHRVKNNLQIVTSLLNLQARNIEDPVSRAPVEQARLRIGALALIHRLIYENEDESALNGFDVGRLMNEISAQLRIAHRERTDIELSCQASACAAPLDNAVPLALLCVEAIINAYTHAFPNGRRGAITLDFGVADGHASLRISDDGIGFDADGDFKSMGRQLMAAFAHQLVGTLKIASSKGNGTVVKLDYQLAAPGPRF